jgi:hypothetical protein
LLEFADPVIHLAHCLDQRLALGLILDRADLFRTCITLVAQPFDLLQQRTSLFIERQDFVDRRDPGSSRAPAVDRGSAPGE